MILGGWRKCGRTLPGGRVLLIRPAGSKVLSPAGPEWAVGRIYWTKEPTDRPEGARATAWNPDGQRRSPRRRGANTIKGEGHRAGKNPLGSARGFLDLWPRDRRRRRGRWWNSLSAGLREFYDCQSRSPLPRLLGSGIVFAALWAAMWENAQPRRMRSGFRILLDRAAGCFSDWDAAGRWWENSPGWSSSPDCSAGRQSEP